MATREAYEEWIDEVAIEVSCDDAWRDRLFSAPLGEELYVGCERPGEVPEYVRDDVVENGLSFLVATAPLEGDEYDVGMVSFAFWSREYPDVVTRTGNEPSPAQRVASDPASYWHEVGLVVRGAGPDGGTRDAREGSWCSWCVSEDGPSAGAEGSPGGGGPFGREGLPVVEDAFVSALECAVRSSLSGPLVATDVPRLPDEGARLSLPPLPLSARGSAVSPGRVGDAARAMLRWGGGTLEGDHLVVTFGGDARFVVAPLPLRWGGGAHMFLASGSDLTAVAGRAESLGLRAVPRLSPFLPLDRLRGLGFPDGWELGAIRRCAEGVDPSLPDIVPDGAALWGLGAGQVDRLCAAVLPALSGLASGRPWGPCSSREDLLYDALLLLWWERTRSPGRLFELLTVVTPGHGVPLDPS